MAGRLLWRNHLKISTKISNFIPCIITSAAFSTTTLKLPALTPTMTEGVVGAWKKSPGDVLKRGDILCEVETDQGLIAFKSFSQAVLAKILVEPQGLFHAHSSHSSHPTITSEKIKINSPVALLVDDEVDYQIWILNNKIREHESEIREHKSKIKKLESEFPDLEKKIALTDAEMESQIHQQTLNSHRNEITSMDQIIRKIRSEITEIYNRINTYLLNDTVKREQGNKLADFPR
jgi:hypothetical protein